MIRNTSVVQTIMSRPKVLVTSCDTPIEVVEFLARRCDVTVLPYVSPTEAQVLADLPGHDGVFLYGCADVNSQFFDIAGRKLKVAVAVSTELAQLDVQEMESRDYHVGGTLMHYHTALAQVAVMLLLNARRRPLESCILREEVRTGSRPQFTPVFDHHLRGSTVGIVGLGVLAHEVMTHLLGFDVGKFLLLGDSPKRAYRELVDEFVSFDNILTHSDFIVVTLPLTSETRGLFDDAAFYKMKQNAVLVNVGGPAVVKMSSLLKALHEGAILAAGLDVVDRESVPNYRELLGQPTLELGPRLGVTTNLSSEERCIYAALRILSVLVIRPIMSTPWEL
ncbi:glyoxylate reductase/hydroxypyruvate reductase-like [Diachasmimorpha longicaudata]|uniref:glyoxylate reductase/hydroxypyruvate reductase-like n=1 Tax=Diachasmimorpha longicaudata TaxID=58733 RepID=UPI0030B8D919